MKHIFIVHSPITYLAALGVIESKKLSSESYTIFSDKFYAKPIKTFSLYPNYSFVEKVISYFWYPSNFDRKLDSIINSENFILYTPMVYDSARIMLSHNRCVGLEFLEEGTTSYITKRSLSFQGQDFLKDSWRANFLSKERIRAVSDILRGILPKMRISFPLYYESYTNCKEIKFWGFSKYSFPAAHTTDVERLSFTKIVNSFPFESESVFQGGDIIFISDDAVENYGYSLDDLINEIKSILIPKVKEFKKEKIFIKSHPRESSKKLDIVTSLFAKNGIHVELLPSNILLEVSLATSPALTLIGFDSTLLFYGTLMGHRAISIGRNMQRVGDGTLVMFNECVEPLN